MLCARREVTDQAPLVEGVWKWAVKDQDPARALCSDSSAESTRSGLCHRKIALCPQWRAMVERKESQSGQSFLKSTSPLYEMAGVR
jgi:hypothetical protein